MKKLMTLAHSNDWEVISIVIMLHSILQNFLRSDCVSVRDAISIVIEVKITSSEENPIYLIEKTVKIFI